MRKSNWEYNQLNFLNLKTEFLTDAKINDPVRLLLIRDQQGELVICKSYEELCIPYDQYAENIPVDAAVCDVTQDTNDEVSIECEEHITGIKPDTVYFFDGESVMPRYPQSDEL